MGIIYEPKMSVLIWSQIKNIVLNKYKLWALKFDNNGEIIGKRPSEKFEPLIIFCYARLNTSKNLPMELILPLIKKHIQQIQNHLRIYKQKELLVLRPTQIFYRKYPRHTQVLIRTILHTQKIKPKVYL